MCKAVIFGGTTEGRLLAEFCHENGVLACISVTSDYGKSLLPSSAYLQVQDRPMNKEDMMDYFQEKSPEFILDATHPFAIEATKNIQEAAKELHIPCIRVLRKEKLGDVTGEVVQVSSAKEAAEYLDSKEGMVFVTTGSKELSAFAQSEGLRKRIFARVLPSLNVFESCLGLGFEEKQLIGMQGPFSLLSNKAMLLHTNASYMVTKEAGNIGGFQEKVQAAMECGVTTVVIGRPTKEEGVSLDEAYEMLAPNFVRSKQQVVLVGIGMGGVSQLTQEALTYVMSSKVVFGAKRMLESVKPYLKDQTQVEKYLAGDILEWLENHQEEKKVVVLYSGDIGFYSGAKKLQEALQQRQDYEVIRCCGISSLAYFCARLSYSWEEVYPGSCHARECNIEHILLDYKKVFLLSAGDADIKAICQRLIGAGYETSIVWIGEFLSYENERIVHGSPREIMEMEFDTLSCLLVEVKDYER